MFKRTHKLILSFLLLFLGFGSLASAQTTAVTGTITDSDSQLWTNAKYNVTFVPNPNFPNLNLYTINGTAITSGTYIGYLSQNSVTNGSGVLSITLLDNNIISPAGSSWRFTIQSNTSAQAVSYPSVAVSGASQSLTTFLSTNSIAPRFPATPGAFGYNDGEISVIPQPGGYYWSTTALLQRFWNGTSWQNTSGAGGPPSGAAGGQLAGTYPNPTLAALNSSQATALFASLTNCGTANYAFVPATGNCLPISGTAFQVNSVALSSSTTVNFLNSAATNGITLTFTNSSVGNVQLGFTGNLTLAGLANQAANTIVGNGTSGSAAPTALAVPSCSGASSALTWTTNTGFG